MADPSLSSVTELIQGERFGPSVGGIEVENDGTEAEHQAEHLVDEASPVQDSAQPELQNNLSPNDKGEAAPPAAQISCSRGLAGWLRAQNLSLAFTSSQTGLL